MKENPSYLFENISDDVLNKESPTGFFDTESSRLQLQLLSEYVREERSRPIFVTGPAGFGKTRLVRRFVTTRRPPRTEIAWIDYTRNPDEAINELILRLQQGDIENRVLVVLDDVEGYSWQQLQPTLNRLFNWKRVRNVIITTRTTDVPFDEIKQIVIPGPPVNPVQPQRGSWSVNYTFRQYIIERGKNDGWGFFSQVSFADKATSPITTFFDLGLGGNGLFKGRPRDEFGIAYAYTDLSSVLKDNIDLLTQAGRRLRVEHQFEAFYNFHITPWLRLTGDLQIIRPTRSIVSTTIIPGGRLVMIF